MVRHFQTSIALALLFVTLLFAVGSFAEQPATAKSIEDEMVYRSRFGRADDITYLLQRGAKADSVNPEGVPVLAIAAGRGPDDPESLKIVKVLMEAGANPNLADKTGGYAIISAARGGNTPVVEYLVNSGANYEVRDASGKTALDIGKSLNNPKIVGIIDQAVARKKEQDAKLRSPEAFVGLSKVYASSACNYQYFGYYLASKQDPAKDADTKARVMQAQARLGFISQQMFVYFPTTPRSYMESLAKTAMQSVYSELDGMVSNRNRRSKGVGTQEDMVKRCKKIVAGMKITPPNAKAEKNK